MAVEAGDCCSLASAKADGGERLKLWVLSCVMENLTHDRAVFGDGQFVVREILQHGALQELCSDRIKGRLKI